MNKKEILEKLKEIKPVFGQEGIVLHGLFGSFSRGDESANSDIDILIETTPEFLQKYRGFRAFSKLDELKEVLQNTFNKKVDFTDKVGLLQHNNSYILEKMIYV